MKRLAAFFCVLAVPLQAGELCDAAAFRAAEESGVPLPILTAITRAETNRSQAGATGPWPWTINHAGKGEWFDTPEAALERIEALVAAGESLDIGCFQINTHWHGDAFAGAADMLDPLANARYAASFLQALFDETGDWKAAVAAYHSRDPDRGLGYAERVAGLMRDPDTPVVAPDARRAPRDNRFPLLLAGDPVSAGSLFAGGGSGQPLIMP